MEYLFVGMDVAKDTLDVVLRRAGQNSPAKTFANDDKGIAALLKWLTKDKHAPIWAFLEATGQYGDEVAERLHQAGCAVSVVNPQCTKSYARAGLVRNQTDKVDAGLLAEFCEKKEPRLWVPPSALHKALRALSRRLDDLEVMRQAERNRRHAAKHPHETLRQGLEEHLAFLAEQIESLKQEIQDLIDAHEELCQQRALLVSIPGIGALTAAKLLGENIQSFPTARTLVAYAGLNPMIRQSGSSLHAKPQLSKLGSRHLRMTMYMPALSARRTNPLVKDFCDRLQARGKAKKAVLGAAMRKLLCLAFGVLKSGVPFDPHFVEKVRMIT